MTKKLHIAILFLTLGFFLMSGTTYACGKSSEKISCENKENSKEANNSCQKDCCKKDHSPNKDQHGCNGKCDHSGCTTSSLHHSLIAINEYAFENNLFNFSTEKHDSLHKTASISAGFPSIWLLPKIK